MDMDLKETLRAILKEELEPIQQHLGNIDKRLDSIAKDVREVKSNHETLQ
ncbi:MAG: hypothetical protein ACI4XL_12895 [Bacillus sp. (in: firmicutes)]